MNTLSVVLNSSKCFPFTGINLAPTDPKINGTILDKMSNPNIITPQNIGTMLYDQFSNFQLSKSIVDTKLVNILLSIKIFRKFGAPTQAMDCNKMSDCCWRG